MKPIISAGFFWATMLGRFGQVNALQTIFARADGTLDEPGLSAWIEEHMERQG